MSQRVQNLTRAINMSWLLNHDQDSQEALFALMRGYRATSDRLLEDHNKLRPPFNTVATGGAHIDPLAKSEAIAAYLRALNRGLTPDDALELAKAEAKLVFDKWNQSRKDYQVHRYANSLDHYLERLSDEFIKVSPV